MTAPRARMRDVAAAAGVSVAAVSRHLSGKLRLPEATARRIDRAVERLGYQAHLQARRLSTGRSETLGLVVPDIANPFFALLADAVQAEAELAGFELLILATRNRPDRELAALARMRANRVDGVLFVTNHADDGALARALATVGPAVLLDEDVAGAALPRVFADNRVGGRLAAEHLLAHGHRRLAILGGPPGLLSTAERHGGFRDAARSGGAEVVAEAFGEYDASAGRIAAHRMLSARHPPDAVFATSGETALGLLDAARMLGVRVPERLSVVAFDDTGPLHLLAPPLTAIRQPVEELGRRGVQALLASLRGQPPRAAGAEVLPVELIERGSVARRPGTSHPGAAASLHAITGG